MWVRWSVVGGPLGVLGALRMVYVESVCGYRELYGCANGYYVRSLVFLIRWQFPF
jgi:hypothetical protein